MSHTIARSARTLTALTLVTLMVTLLSHFTGAQTTTLRTAYYDTANPPFIHQISWSNGHPVDANTGFQGQPGSGYISMSGFSANPPHIFHIGPNGHIYDLFNNGSWHNFDATAAAGATIAIANSPLATFFASNTNYHAYYLNGPHVLELIYAGGTTWKKFDPSAAANAPDTAGGGSALTCFFANNTIHVYYIGGDTDIHELIWTGGTTWKTFNPTAAAGAQGAIATAGMTSFFYNGKIHIYYIGFNDGAVHELLWVGGTTWTTACASCAAGAPLPINPSATALTSLVDTTTGDVHVYYAAASLVELIGTGTAWTYDLPIPTQSPDLLPLDSFFTGGTDSTWVHYIDSQSRLHAAFKQSGLWTDENVTNTTGVFAGTFTNAGSITTLTSYVP